MTQYWLMKSEPSCVSIDDLYHAPNQTLPWDGVRNYQARNFMRSHMHPGDFMFFYHSGCKPPGIVGIAEIVSHAYPDYTAFDPNSQHPDPKSTPENPRWFMVDVTYREKFKEILSLSELKQYPELEKMHVLRRGNRLSITPVTANEWHFIMSIAKRVTD